MFYIPRTLKSSNSWIAMLSVPMVSNIMTVVTTTVSECISVLRKAEGRSLIFTLDDMSHSGDQISDIITNLALQYKGPIVDFYVGLTFITDHAHARLMGETVEFLSNYFLRIQLPQNVVVIPTFDSLLDKDNIYRKFLSRTGMGMTDCRIYNNKYRPYFTEMQWVEDDDIGGRSLVYFQHKLPDDVSTYTVLIRRGCWYNDEGTVCKDLVKSDSAYLHPLISNCDPKNMECFNTHYSKIEYTYDGFHINTSTGLISAIKQLR